jgi:hypothetical protein
MRSCFLSVTAPPSQLVGVNHPSRTKSDQITAVELMTLLHKSEKEAGLKCTIEGEFSETQKQEPSSADLALRSNSYRHLLLHVGCLPPRGPRRLHATTGRRACPPRPLHAHRESNCFLSFILPLTLLSSHRSSKPSRPTRRSNPSSRQRSSPASLARKSGKRALSGKASSAAPRPSRLIRSRRSCYCHRSS